VIELSDARTDRRRVPGPALRLAAVEAGAPERTELEAFVRAGFQRRHDASVSTFMPTLLSFRDASGDLRGVIGLRSAGSRPLYLEQYLDQPVERAIAAATGKLVHRSEVVEVGNLAGASCRTAMRMVAALPSYLRSREYRWIVFTATSAVRGILQGFGAPLAELARADGSRVQSGADQWGRYYDTDPRVLVGYLPASRWIPGFNPGLYTR